MKHLKRFTVVAVLVVLFLSSCIIVPIMSYDSYDVEQTGISSTNADIYIYTITIPGSIAVENLRVEKDWDFDVLWINP